MRKQLLLWPDTVVPEENCEAGHPDDAAFTGRFRVLQEWDSHAERSHS
jgi:hypothetical protein